MAKIHIAARELAPLLNGTTIAAGEDHPRANTPRPAAMDRARVRHHARRRSSRTR